MLGQGQAFAADSVQKVSTDSLGGEATGDSSAAHVSAGGRYVVYQSVASNIVAGDTNSDWDIFRYDKNTDSTIRVSVSTSDAESNSYSFNPHISRDGRYIVFESVANNLVSGDTNNSSDIFLRDVVAGTTERISIDSSENEVTGDSHVPQVSADGRYVVFHHTGPDMVPGDINGVTDVFVRDRTLGTTTRVSVSSGEGEGEAESLNPSMSENGRYIVFESAATAFDFSDSNGSKDIYLRDTTLGTTSAVSVSSAGAFGCILFACNGSHAINPSISVDGGYVAFESPAPNLDSGESGFSSDSDIFLRNISAGTTKRISDTLEGTEGNGESTNPAVSENGSYVVFQSTSTNIFGGDSNSFSDVFRWNASGDKSERVSIADDFTQGDANSYRSTIDSSGLWAAFESEASTLVPGDTPGNMEVYLVDIGLPDTAAPVDPTVSSPSHTIGVTYRDSTVQVSWSGAADAGSAVDGFSYTWTKGATDLPNQTKNAEGSATTTTTSALSDGSWYFHLRTRDNAGNWTSTVHKGPFVISQDKISIWPRWSNAPYGYWSKLAGTVKTGGGSPVAGATVHLQYKSGSTWKWLKTVTTNSTGYYQHWFYYEGVKRTYRARHIATGYYSNLTTPTFTKNITTWNNYRPKVRYCQWTKIHGKYGGPNGVYPNTTLYLQRWTGSKWAWQATVKTNSTGYYAAWMPVCPTTTYRMATAGSVVKSASFVKKGSSIAAWQNTKVHASIKDGYGSGVGGIKLYLQKWNGSSWTWQATCTTSSTGYCHFGSKNPSGWTRVATGGSKVVSKGF